MVHLIRYGNFFINLIVYIFIGGPADRVRWRKDHLLYRPNSDVSDKPKLEQETDAQVEGNLATEVSFIVLDTLEQIVQVNNQFFLCISRGKNSILSLPRIFLISYSSWILFS